MANGKEKLDPKGPADPGPPPEAPAAAPGPELVTLRMPIGTSGVTVQGMAIEVKDGLVKVEAWVAAHLKECFGAIEAKL